MRMRQSVYLLDDLHGINRRLQSCDLLSDMIRNNLVMSEMNREAKKKVGKVKGEGGKANFTHGIHLPILDLSIVQQHQ